MTQEEVAARLGKSRPVVANALRLLNLPKGVKMQLDEGFLTAGHARLLASLPEADAIRWGNDVVLRGLNVRELETARSATRPKRRRSGRRTPRRTRGATRSCGRCSWPCRRSWGAG